jgi:hypothetical protein
MTSYEKKDTMLPPPFVGPHCDGSSECEAAL